MPMDDLGPRDKGRVLRIDNAAEASEDDGGNLADQVFEQISHAIILGELPPGSKISEPELSRRFGVSRGTLREAIRRLQERKLVSRTPNLGARVVELSLRALSEIFTVREALEGMAAREAAKRISDEEIAHLRAMLRGHQAQFDAASEAPYAQGFADEDFHFAIARCSRNEMLIRLLCDEYYQLIRLYRSQHKSVPGRARRAFAEHCRIVDALADRDAELTELLMRRHIAAARAAMEQSLAAADRPIELAQRGRRRAGQRGIGMLETDATVSTASQPARRP